MHIKEARERVLLHADHHFRHGKIAEYCGRPFGSVDEMDEFMIRAWNETVPEDGIVYHVGDFTLGPVAEASKILHRLNGAIFIVPGDHDRWLEAFHCDVPTGIKSGSGEVVWKSQPIVHLEFETNGKYPVTIALSHYPFETWSKSYHGSFHAHAHVHGRLPRNGRRRMDVGVDAVGYHPIRLGEFLDELIQETVPKETHDE